MKTLEQMVWALVIEIAQSQWTNLILLVFEKDDGLLFCIDYQLFNVVNIPDTYPLSRMNKCIYIIKESKMLIALSALLEYWKVLFKNDDKDETTSTSILGTYSYLQVPLYLQSAPATFQRALHTILSEV